MISNPVTNLPSTNPAATSLDNTSAAQLQSMYGKGSAWKWEECTDVKASNAEISVITIPFKTQQPEIMERGQSFKFSQPAMGSYVIVPQLHGTGYAINIDSYNGLGPVQSVIDGMVTSLAQVGETHIKRLAVTELYNLGTESRPQFDGLTFFNGSHPVDPSDHSRKSRTLGSATFSNTFDNYPLTAPNLLRALTYCMVLPLADGENAPIEEITLAVPSVVAVYAMQLVHAMSIATNYSGGSDGFPTASSDAIVGADSNIIQAAGRIYRINVMVLDNYPVTVSSGLVATNYHWFLWTHLSPLFNLRYQQMHTYQELVSEKDYPVFMQRNRLHTVSDVLVVGGPLIPQALLRFRSGTT